MSTKYIKIIDNDLVYYIANNIVIDISYGRTQIMSHADFIINKKTNEIIKCRYPLEMIFDRYDHQREVF